MHVLSRIPVVTCFLHRRGRILLLRRSDRVGTYAGLWAGISGYVERVPLEQGLLEICEEVGACPEDVRVCAVGPPIPVDDAEQGRYWLVYPFLFGVRREFSIQPDWESVGACWVWPGVMSEYEAVPGLAEVLSAVWPPFGSAGLWRAAWRVAGDRTSGATALAVQALRALQAFSRTRMARKNVHLMVRAARALAALRPSMGIIAHVMALAADDPDTAASMPRELTLASGRCARRGAERIRAFGRVATFSASSICERALRLWAEEHPGGEVIVAESRPKLEGVSLAVRLAAAGLKVRLVTDAQMGLVLREAQALLLGADAITEDDLLINKIGTHMLVMIAREYGVPAYAVCQTHKIAPPGWPIALERQPPEDVYQAHDFRVQNVAFDATPISQFAEVITERGPITKPMLHEVRSGLAQSPLVYQDRI